MSYQEPNIEMDCHYPEVLQAYLYVMPAHIDDPLDSVFITYYFPNHLTVVINTQTNSVSLTGAIESDAAGLIMETIEQINSIDRLSWKEAYH